MMDKLRSYRLADIAIFDLAISILFLMIIALSGIFGTAIKQHYILFSILGSIPIGELTHLVLGIETPITKKIKNQFQ